MEAYAGLFFTAFLSASLLPGGSEILLLGLLSAGYEPMSLWLVATAGNTLGSVLNWALGRYLLHFQDRSWFPFKASTLDKAQRGFARYGVWSLLFAWLPVVGDPLTFVAGVMRVHFSLFVPLCGLGKAARYAVLIFIGDGLAV